MDTATKSSIAGIFLLAGFALTAPLVQAVQPQLFVQPGSIPASGSATVSGIGFCGDQSCSSVTISIDGLVVLRDVPVQPDGTFVVTDFGPPAPTGQHTVTAEQDTPGGKLSASASLLITVADFAQPPTTPPGATLPGGTPTASPVEVTSPTATATETSPGPGATPTPTATADERGSGNDDGGLPWWGLLAIIAGIAAAGFVAVWRWRMRHS